MSDLMEEKIAWEHQGEFQHICYDCEREIGEHDDAYTVTEEQNAKLIEVEICESCLIERQKTENLISNLAAMAKAFDEICRGRS